MIREPVVDARRPRTVCRYSATAMYRFIGSHSRRHGNIYRQCERVDPGHIIKCIYRIKLYYQENWAQEGWGFWGSGGFSYLYEPLWWLGMITMILGEVANFAAYAFAPAVLVTPLGALSIIFSAVLAHFVLKEKLHMFGVVGCILCVVGSVGIVLHAPKEREIDSIDEIWHLATEPGFIVYSCVAVVSVLFLIFWVAERSGHRKMLVYIAICSTMGSLTVISVKAVAIALKLSFGGSNQFIYIQTWFFIVVVIVCCLVQLNYLNKALDSFNTAVVSPVYYVMFTILTIFANMIMYKDSFSRNATQIATQLCGFVTIVAGTFLLHKTRDMGNEPPLPDDEICLDGGSVRPDRLSQSSS
ncbi:probable magnesium transporter NIPA2 isoform X3 [Oryza sativa Japonica Group]|uniref:probable magnesium transporter NIPA2 isoform X3 n=1 Tax=Oryza sativa subsp. japonica TaxID=39947 RepID=UPI000E1BDC83|nr:probable magnesium transporter NIPA2 isoform X3 [Oryza sativa Japonica Group]